MNIPLWVLWTYDIECTKILSPHNGDSIPPGETMHISARFKNLGINDTVNIPVTAKVYNAGEETPIDSLLYMSSYIIHDLNWRCSPAGLPNKIEVDFGSMEVPPTTIPNNWLPGRAMRIKCGLAEVWMDENPMNDIKIFYVNCHN